MDERQIISEAKRDGEWLDKNFARFKTLYEDKYIAVKSGKLVGMDADIRKLVRELRAKGIDPAYTVVRHIPRKGVVEIF